MPITYTKVSFDYLRRIPTSNRAALRRAMEYVAADMTKEIKRSISRPFPPASKPFRPPHRRTGDLRTSVELRVIGDSVGARWADMVPYAPHLEFGTVNMEPRPFVHPVLNGRGQRQKWQARTAAYLKEELLKSTRPRDRRMANLMSRGRR